MPDDALVIKRQRGVAEVWYERITLLATLNACAMLSRIRRVQLLIRRSSCDRSAQRIRLS